MHDAIHLKESREETAYELAAKKAVNDASSDVKLFCLNPSASHGDVSHLHPTPAQMLKLWQIYLDNVDPLLKITHAPTLQRRIIDVAGEVTSIRDSSFRALLFGICSTAVLSLTPEECQARFRATKDELSARYQLGCQHALSACHFVHTTSHECLSALLLYLVSLPDSGTVLY